jgi:hypothetical protein
LCIDYQLNVFEQKEFNENVPYSFIFLIFLAI